jgi:flavin reductase (DIM6/NTAB) family NADH-FMN oxidoreductase RutF
MKEIDFKENVADTLAKLASPGLLLVSAGPGGRPNAMTIGWGLAGVAWGRPVFSVLVRPSRYTLGNIEATGEFVVAVPGEGMHDAVMYCGTQSGRDVDKFAELGLTAVEAATVAVPLIGECARHYECRVVHYSDVSDAALAAEVRRDCYSTGNLHRIYHGQILRTTETG